MKVMQEKTMRFIFALFAVASFFSLTSFSFKHKYKYIYYYYYFIIFSLFTPPYFTFLILFNNNHTNNIYKK